jgi:hypothetical protein
VTTCAGREKAQVVYAWPIQCAAYATIAAKEGVGEPVVGGDQDDPGVDRRAAGQGDEAHRAVGQPAPVGLGVQATGVEERALGAVELAQPAPAMGTSGAIQRASPWSAVGTTSTRKGSAPPCARRKPTSGAWKAPLSQAT